MCDEICDNAPKIKEQVKEIDKQEHEKVKTKKNKKNC